MSKHIPGPWSVETIKTYGLELHTVVSEDRIIASVTCPDLIGKNNAQLIAAAPEMYDALHFAAIFIAEVGGVETAMYKQIALALAKAESRE